MAFVQARVNAAVDAAVATANYVQLHTGDPGPAGTSNVAAGIDRAPVSFAAAASGTTSDVASFTIPAAGGPFSHVSLWTAATDGTFDGSGACTPAETFGGAGTLDVTVTVSGTTTP